MRLIIHLAALNALLKKPDQGESGKLPFVGDLVNISLVAGEVLYHFGEDLSVCFYLFRLPTVWRTRMCLNRRIWGTDVGKARGWYYLASTVVPMGWSWAVEVIEHIHCKLGEQAGLPTEAMMTIASGLPPCHATKDLASCRQKRGGYEPADFRRSGMDRPSGT